MASDKSKWITCTPKRFVGDETFFARDSGLLSEGFRELGYQTQSIMLGPVMDNDDRRCMRASIEELEDHKYWETHQATGVVLYAWGMPQYTPIAKAIKKAGLFLVVHMDTGGLLSPRVDGLINTRLLFRRYTQEKGFFLGNCAGAISWLRGMVPRLRDIPRIKHLECAHIIGTVSPIAVKRIKNFARYYHREDIEDRVQLIEHPISPTMVYDGQEKEKIICAIGRWTEKDAVKRPALLLASLKYALEREPYYLASIVGEYDHSFQNLLNRFPCEIRTRIKLLGQLSNDETAEILCSSRISLCTSLSESFHIASAEALCCGCGVVSYKSPYLPSFDYFVSQNSGTMAGDDTSHSLGGALVEEMAHWEKKERDPEALSKRWTSRLHAKNVAKMILKASDLTQQQ